MIIDHTSISDIYFIDIILSDRWWWCELVEAAFKTARETRVSPKRQAFSFGILAKIKKIKNIGGGTGLIGTRNAVL